MKSFGMEQVNLKSKKKENEIELIFTYNVKLKLINKIIPKNENCDMIQNSDHPC